MVAGAHPIAATLVLAVVGFVVRLVLILAFRHGGEDLQIYYAFGIRAAHGINPYSEQITPTVQTLPPGEVAIFALLLHVWPSATALRAAFALADVGVIALLGLGVSRPLRWRLAAASFYAFNPLLLGSWVILSEDKSLYFPLLVAVVISAEVNRTKLAWIVSSVLMALRQLSVVFILPMTAAILRSRGLRQTLGYLALFLLGVIASVLPFWPADIRDFASRSLRLGGEPSHSSLFIVLSSLGLYSPVVVRPLILLTNVSILGFLLMRFITLADAIVLSVAAFFALLPDTTFGRLIFAAMALFLITSLSARQWVLMWVATVPATICQFVSGPSQFALLTNTATHLPLVASTVQLLLSGSREGHLIYAISGNVVIAVALVLWARDKITHRQNSLKDQA